MFNIDEKHSFLIIMRRVLALLLSTLFGSSLWADDLIHTNVAIALTKAAKPPAQPQSGPGGSNLTHAEVIVQLRGSGAQAYWLFEPAKPTPQKGPLIIFNHGWAAMDPSLYKAWIDHLVGRGNVIVFPVYQDSLLTAAKDFTPNAIAAVQNAIHTLQNEPGHVKPQLDKVAIVGHSMGGVISANMAALWKGAGLPFPRAIMCVEPGKTWGSLGWIQIQLADLSQIPAQTLLLSVAGDRDQLVNDVDAKRIFNESTQVSSTNKNYGKPSLSADHLAALALGTMPRGAEQGNRMTNSLHVETNSTVNALDFYGTWKLFDGLTDAAFYGQNRNSALGNTPEQRFMGVWSDGVPVKELKVTTQP